MAKAYPSDDEVDVGEMSKHENRKEISFKHHIHRGSNRQRQDTTQIESQYRRQAETGNTSRRTNNHGEARETKRISYRRLIKLSKSHKDPNNLLLELTGDSSFDKIFADKIKSDWLYYILHILSDVVTSSLKRNLTELLLRIEKQFLLRLNEVLGEISIRSKLYLSVWDSKTNLSKTCLMILKIVQVLAQTIRSLVGKCKHVVLLVKEIQSDFVSEDKILSEEIQNTNSIISATVHALDNKRKPPTTQANTTDETPDDFRGTSILPTTEDIHSFEAPFLRPIKPRGNYDSLDAYLDIQFRLLREDFMYPLRNGISEYIESLYELKQNTKIREIRLYENVQIVGPVCANDGINYLLQFDTSKLMTVDWVACKRLLYGSLLCLSSDYFSSIYYATVTEREIPNLKDGIIQVRFETLPRTSGSTKFLMAESTAYFEAFRHVLEGLQLIEASLPFQRYIIDCNQVIKPPSYLLGKGVAVYDFTCILPEMAKENCCFKAVPALNTVRWPSSEDMGLDKSQYEALKLALTKELAIIQGPPGTGKTYIGLQIAKMLLENSSYWKGTAKGSPILVICYTNHALDQFLEGILQFSKGSIVRIGGRSQNETLAPYNLSRLKLGRVNNRLEKKAFYVGKKESENAKYSCERIVKRISSQLEKTFSEVHSYHDLQSQMTIQQRKSFEISRVGKGHVLRKWLSLPPSVILRYEEIPDNEAARRLWVRYILDCVEKIPENERKQVQDLCAINLHERARLYKTWIAELISQENKKQEINEMNSKPSLSKRSKFEIIYPNGMLTCIRSKQTRRQLYMFKKAVDFENWLGLDGTSESTAAIAYLYSDIIHEGEWTGGFDEATEERKLDDEIESVDDIDENGSEMSEDANQRTNNGWIRTWNAKNERDHVKTITKDTRPLSDEEADNFNNMWAVSEADRHSLYWHWIIKYREQLKNNVKESEEKYMQKSGALTELRDKETMEILQSKHVIGLTTTGAAMNRKLLQMIKPAIVIVEEAAEVLESHIVTALNAECKHLILIGDHKQLRPSTTVYHLAKQYHLDISLFERMITNEVPSITLSQQHRMRPEISELLKNDFLYPDLKDHKSVSEYEHIHGIDSDVFFIDHSIPELRIHDSTSYRNPHEAKFVARLCEYLIKQGYSSKQITVLTPYMGQFTLLRNEIRGQGLADVHITAVDNFQGEENDIILLSLVRSNVNTTKKNPIGFLAIANRICVALSRAKKGMYVIGNFSLLKEHGKLWSHIVGLLEQSGGLGPELTLRCRNHPETIVKASKPGDFDQAPEGGCMERCNTVLECNHICPKLCHVIDRDHKIAKCKQPCETIFSECGHKCKKKCYEDCKECETQVQKTVPHCGHLEYMPCHCDAGTWNCPRICDFKFDCGHECGRRCLICNKTRPHAFICKKLVSRQLQCNHTIQQQCYEDPDSADCILPCSNTLPCGHQCGRTCSECKKANAHIDTCKKVVSKTLQCGHVVDMQCCQDALSTVCTKTVSVTLLCGHIIDMQCSQDPHTVICREPCSVELTCGHTCAGTCSTCFRGKIHQQCEKTCGRTLPCGHKCSYRCSDRCPPCNSPCEWICSHGIRCKKKCSERCDPCLKDCKYKCEHSSCTKLCYENCDRKQCNEKCKKRLSCGHPCIGLCGELCICSQFCYVQKKKIHRRNKKEGCYIKVNTCKCVIPHTVLDEYMSESTYAAGESVRRCPTCRKLMSANNKRYANAIKLDWEDVFREFRSMRISERNLRRRCERLHDRMQKIKENGLDEPDVKKLQEILDTCSVDTLPADEKAVELLEELLRVCPGLDTPSGTELLIKPVDIKDLIMKDRTLGTQQFWSEIQREIKRIDYCLQLTNLHTQVSSDTEEVVTKTVAMLKEDKLFTDKRQRMVEQVIAKITDLSKLKK